MKRNILIPVFLIFFASNPNAAPDPPRASDEMREWLGFLASDSMRGRANLSPEIEQAAQWIAEKYQAFGLEPLPKCNGYFHEYDFPEGPMTDSRGAAAKNVAGLIRGSDPVLRDEFIILSAHYDHLGVQTNEDAGQDVIFNGADDDASGIVTLLGTAKLLHDGFRDPQVAKPKRSIVFIAFSGEELAMTGSSQFIKDSPIPLEKIVTVVNFEMVGRPPETLGRKKVWMSGSHASDLREVLRPAFEEQGWSIVDCPYGEAAEQRFFAMADNRSFVAIEMDEDAGTIYGIPAHTIAMSGFEPHYHTVDDEAEHIDFENLAQLAEAMRAAVRLLADRSEWIRWKEVQGGKFERYAGPRTRRAESAEPTRASGAELAKLLQGEIPLQFGAAAFHDGKWFIDSSHGLLELNARAICAVNFWNGTMQWNRRISSNSDTLWLERDMEWGLCVHTKDGWQRLPAPTEVNASNGKPLSQLVPGLGADGAYLIGKRYDETWLYRFDPAKSEWRRTKGPDVPNERMVHAVVSLPSGELYVVVPRGSSAAPWEAEAKVEFCRLADGEWSSHAEPKTGYPGELLRVGDSAFLRVGTELFVARPSGVEKFQAPGKCEAIAASSKAKLLASFVDLGVFEFDGDWKKLFPCPYPPNEGEHFAHLAEHDGEVLLATSRHFQLIESQTFYSGRDSLWIGRSGEFEAVQTPVPLLGPDARTLERKDPSPEPRKVGVEDVLETPIYNNLLDSPEMLQVVWERHWRDPDAGATPRWRRRCGFEGLAVAKDGECVVAERSHLIAFDRDGKELWNRKFEGAQALNAQSLVRMPDADFILHAKVEGPGTSSEVKLIRCESNGKERWRRSLPAIDNSVGRSAPICASRHDGLFVAIAKQSTDPGDAQFSKDFLLLELDGNGEVLRQRTYGGTNSEEPSCVRATSDGGAVLLGSIFYGGKSGNDIYVVKTGPDLAPEWSLIIGGSGNDNAQAIELGTDGTILVAGSLDECAALIQIDASGSVDWMRKYGNGRQLAYANSVMRSGDGFVLCGSSLFAAGDSKNRGWNAFVLAVDRRGAPQGLTILGGEGNDHLYELYPSEEGTILAVGQWNSESGTTGPEGWLLKLKQKGK